MFNPTIVRSIRFGAYSGVVISNSLGSDDSYFQTYRHVASDDSEDLTELCYATPYATQQGAILHFEVWARDMAANL